jgi:hypothetical protein
MMKAAVKQIVFFLFVGKVLGQNPSVGWLSAYNSLGTLVSSGDNCVKSPGPAVLQQALQTGGVCNTIPYNGQHLYVSLTGCSTPNGAYTLFAFQDAACTQAVSSYSAADACECPSLANVGSPTIGIRVACQYTENNCYSYTVSDSCSTDAAVESVGTGISENCLSFGGNSTLITCSGGSAADSWNGKFYLSSNCQGTPMKTVSGSSCANCKTVQSTALLINCGGSADVNCKNTGSTGLDSVSSSSSSSDITVGAVAGIVIGAVAGIALLIAVGSYYYFVYYPRKIKPLPSTGGKPHHAVVVQEMMKVLP